MIVFRYFCDNKDLFSELVSTKAANDVCIYNICILLYNSSLKSCIVYPVPYNHVTALYNPEQTLELKL